MAGSWKKLKAAVKFAGLAKRGNKETLAAAAHCSADDVDIILEHLLQTQGKKKMRLKERKVSQLLLPATEAWTVPAATDQPPADVVPRALPLGAY